MTGLHNCHAARKRRVLLLRIALSIARFKKDIIFPLPASQPHQASKLLSLHQCNVDD